MNFTIKTHYMLSLGSKEWQNIDLPIP